MNRVENAPLKPVKEMEKLERRSAVIDDNPKIAFVRWKDNKVVTVISSKYGLNPTAKIKVESILRNLNASKNTTKEWAELIVWIKT